MGKRNYLTQSKLREGPDDTLTLQWKLVGEWDKAVRLMSRLSPEVKNSSIKAQMRIADEIMKRVKGHLRKQDLPWAPLSPKTVAKKDKADMDPRTLIGRGTYLNSIKAWRVGNQYGVMVGVKRGIYTYTYGGKKSRWEVSQIAVAHEFSSGRRIPRRPLWNPTLAEMGGAKGIQTLFVKYFIATLRRNGVPIKPFQNLL